MTTTPIPTDLYWHVEPEAGHVLPVTRWRHHEEFCPNWAYIGSPQASNDAVAAALLSAPYIDEKDWALALAAHAPVALGILDEAGWPLEQYLRGHVPGWLADKVDDAVNESLGYDLAPTAQLAAMRAWVNAA
jgi:hypothetical protein